MPGFAANRKDALISAEGRIDFEELDSRVRAEAARLNRSAELQVLVGDRSFDFIIRFLAALRAETPLAVLSAEATENERRTRAETLIRHRAAIHPDTAVILFTSGSSGESKAVQLTKAGIEANTRAVIDRLEFARAEEQTLFLPLAYSFGLLGQLVPALRSGMTTRLVASFPEVKAILEGPAPEVRGMWSGVASHWSALARIAVDRGPFEAVTHAISAGSRLDSATKLAMRRLFPNAVLYNNYGQTEASPRILSMTSRHPRFFEDTTGFAVEGIEVRISPEGELEARGPQIMRGYLGDPEGTRDRIGGGWLRTGDLAEIDAEGLVSVRGRIDDLVKIAGERVSPHELSAAVEARNWASEVCVLPMEDETYGTRLVLFLGAVGERAPSDALIVKSLRETLAPAKLPRRIVRLPSLPRNANGKFDRARLLEILKSNPP